MNAAVDVRSCNIAPDSPPEWLSSLDSKTMSPYPQPYRKARMAIYVKQCNKTRQVGMEPPPRGKPRAGVHDGRIAETVWSLICTGGCT